MNPIAVFLCQFVYVVLLGLQSLNVQGHHYAASAITSTCLGVCGFTLTASIARVKDEGIRSPTGIAFVLAGPLGICTSIAVHDMLKAWVG